MASGVLTTTAAVMLSCMASFAGVQSVSNFDPGYRLFDRHKDEIWRALEDPAAYGSLIETLPANAIEVIAAWWLTAEVENGGFNQYFFNSYGAMIDEAIAGLDLTGQSRFAAAARLAKAEFSNDVPFDRARRIQSLTDICARSDECFKPADELYYSTTGEEWADYRRSADELAEQLLR